MPSKRNFLNSYDITSTRLVLKLAEVEKVQCLSGPYDRRNVVMAYQPEHSPAKMSRRSVLLRGAACAAGAAGATTILAVSANSAKADPLPQKSVQYQDTPKGDRECSGCSLFVAPNSCKNVVGEISPKGWCMLWRKA